MNRVEIRVNEKVYEEATQDQIHKIWDLANPETVEVVEVQVGGFGLPEGYLAVRIDYRNGGPIYGGIDAEGVMST